MILDLLFPKPCLCCGRWGSYLCSSCRQSLSPVRETGCFYCDRKTEFGETHESCSRPGGLDGVFSCYYYTKEVRSIIRALKYGGCTDAFQEIFFSIPLQAVLTLSTLRTRSPFLQPVPLHLQRQKQRGYNQSLLIAQFVSYTTQYPLVAALDRNKYTLPQARAQSRLHRHYNIRNAFSVSSPDAVSGKTIVLVDDVITSGNTATEAARTLKKAGAREVFIWTLARQ